MIKRGSYIFASIHYPIQVMQYKIKKAAHSYLGHINDTQILSNWCKEA